MSENGNSTTLLWIVVGLLVIAVAWLAIPKGGDSGLGARVEALEQRFVDVNGGDIVLSDYVTWADSISEWAAANSHARHVGLLWNWTQDGTISCDPDCDTEVTPPPDGGPCKPGQC